jgi:thiol-disulfide isomerase/thioredoxin
MRALLLLFALALPATAHAQVALGGALPLQDATFAQAGGGSVALGTLAGERGTVLVFWANKCPWVDRYEDRLLALASRYGAQGYRFVLVNSFGPSVADETAEMSAARAASKGYSLPYLTDTDGALAAALGASRAPEVYVFDAARTLVYVGSVDDNPTNANAASRLYLQESLDAGLQGDRPETAQTESLGCMIKR